MKIRWWWLITLPAMPAQAQTPDPCKTQQWPDAAQCSTLTVPENRSRSEGRRIPIRFVVIRANQPSTLEPLFLFAGGPGQGSTEMIGLATGLLAPVSQIRDIVMVDQRGSGGSNPLGCPVDLVKHPTAAFGHVFDPALFKACRVELERRADLRLYTTERAVEDVDQVRQYLGYDKILLWGGSYGTRIAQAYLKAYPSRVAAAVLDGVVPFDFTAPSNYARSLQQSLDRVIADCAASASCAKATPDLGAAFGRLVARVAAAPVSTTFRGPDSTTVPVTMSAGDFGYAVRGILYSSRGARRLPGLIEQIDRTGDFSPLAQAYFDRAFDFNGGFADGLHFAIFCAEDVPGIPPARIDSLTTGTFIGRYLIDEYRTICGQWVRAPVTGKSREPVSGTVPVLLLSGWFDPVTPPETGERVASGLANAKHLVIRNEAHGAGFGCARPALLHVLTKGTLEGLPDVCGNVTNLFDSTSP